MSKKILLGFVATAMLFSLTGCGKSLECTMSEEGDGMTMTQTMNVGFNGDKAANLKADISVKLDEQYTDYIDEFEDTLKEQFKDFEQSGMTLDVKSGKDNVSVIIEADFENMTDEQKNEIGFNSESNNYDDIKSSLEDSGYTCK